MPEKMPAALQIAIFDVCNTLYRANTTAGFIRFVHSSQHNRLRTLLTVLVCNRASPLRYALILCNKICRRDLSRDLLIRTLRGMGKMELEELAQRYVCEDLTGRQIQPVHSELEQRRKLGVNTYLASASLDIVIAAIAKTLNTNGFVASELGFVNLRCTGALNSDLTGNKVQALAPLWSDQTAAGIFVCSDNASDASLFVLAQEKMVVVKGNHTPSQLKFKDAIYVQTP